MKTATIRWRRVAVLAACLALLAAGWFAWRLHTPVIVGTHGTHSLADTVQLDFSDAGTPNAALRHLRETNALDEALRARTPAVIKDRYVDVPRTELAHACPFSPLRGAALSCFLRNSR